MSELLPSDSAIDVRCSPLLEIKATHLQLLRRFEQFERNVMKLHALAFNSTESSCLQQNVEPEAPVNTHQVISNEWQTALRIEEPVTEESERDSNTEQGNEIDEIDEFRDANESVYLERIKSLEEYISYVSDVSQDQIPVETSLDIGHVSRDVAPSQLYAVGMNDDGQLGIPNDDTGYACTVMFRKVRVNDNLSSLTRTQFAQVVCGSMFAMAIDSEMRLWSWGFEECIGRTGKEDVPQVIPTLQDIKVMHVACGEYITVCVDENDQMWTWGAFRNEKGERHLTADIGRSQLPIQVPGTFGAFAGPSRTSGKQNGVQAPGTGHGPSGVVSISAGESHVACLTLSGHSYTWGLGEYGQLGRPWTSFREQRGSDLIPTRVLFPSEARIRNVWAVGFHTFWDTSVGLFGCGKNGFGELGLGHCKQVLYPTRVPIDERIVQVSGGLHHVLFLDDQGTMFASGRNTFGQCGTITTECRISRVDGMPRIRAIACGKSSNHSCTTSK